jgi:hypothetical protein
VKFIPGILFYSTGKDSHNDKPPEGVMGNNERIILIKGDADKWYNQAIFIVNKDLPPGKLPVDFVAEAEKIIADYMRKKKAPQSAAPFPDKIAVNPAKPKVNKKKFDSFINFCLILGTMLIVAALVYGLTG